MSSSSFEIFHIVPPSMCPAASGVTLIPPPRPGRLCFSEKRRCTNRVAANALSMSPNVNVSKSSRAIRALTASYRKSWPSLTTGIVATTGQSSPSFANAYGSAPRWFRSGCESSTKSINGATLASGAIKSSEKRSSQPQSSRILQSSISSK
eukprot:SAG22_NODE_86_length_21440_cov_288.248700_22_plen_151_part_00